MTYKKLERDHNGHRKLNAHKHIKKKVLKRDNNKCVRCKKKAEVTHHIIPIWEDRTKVNDMTNMESLCKKCHYAIHHYKTHTP